MVMQKIGVVGAGMMGAEIALCFARFGYDVIMSDVSQENAEKGKAKLAAILNKHITNGKLDQETKEQYLGRITPTGTVADMAGCDFVVEAIVEVLEVKHEIYKALDAVCKKDAIIASNTSSISITKLAAVLSAKRAQRFIGTHFNSPASVMKLVEVIPALQSSEEVVTETMALLSAIGKVPVKVKDVVGFALNRMFAAFYLEACRLVEEGVCSVEDVDTVCLHGLGHPVGVFKLLDVIGLDLHMNVDRILFDAYGDRFRPSPCIQRLTDSGRLGRKTGQGFYLYK